MLLEAANWDPSRSRLSRGDVDSRPQLRRYVEGWRRDTDIGVVARVGASPVAAAWARHFSVDDQGYGFVCSDVPELAMAVAVGHRGRGLGRLVLDRLIVAACESGAVGLSLSVEAGNVRARRLYDSRGFAEVSRLGSSVVMLLRLLPRP